MVGNPYLLTQATDNHGNSVSVTYDAFGRVASVADAAGRTLTLNWNSNDSYALASLVLNAGGNTRQWTFTTDGNSCLTSIKFPDPATGGVNGPVLNLTPDGAGRITALTDLNGNTWNYSYYSPAGTFGGFAPTVVYQVTDPFSHLATTYSVTYSSPTRTTTITDQAGRVATHLYNVDTTMATTSTPLISKVTDPAVTGDAAAYYATYTWSTTDGTLRSMVDRRGNTWQYSWDTNNYGDLLSETDANGYVTQYLYNAGHRVTRKMCPEGHKTLYSYSGAWDLTQQVVDPKSDPNDPTWSNPSGLAVTTNYGYNADGTLGSVQVGGDPATTFGNYDVYGNAGTMTNPVGSTWSYSFDAFNDKLSETEPTYDGINTATTSFTYDKWNRLTQVMSPGVKN